MCIESGQATSLYLTIVGYRKPLHSFLKISEQAVRHTALDMALCRHLALFVPFSPDIVLGIHCNEIDVNVVAG